MDGKRDVNALVDRDFEDFPPRNVAETWLKHYRRFVIDPLLKLKAFIDSQHEPTYWYHKKLNRVPTIDQCYEYDTICQFEANQQLKRDRKLDQEIIILLKQRFKDCMMYERFEREKCRELMPAIEEAKVNYFIKYGETGMGDIAKPVYLKQKHRMAWERRHGEVGSGMREKHYKSDGTVYWK